MSAKEANGAPDAFWHIRQWQMLTLTGGADSAKRMAPHWQPPVRTGFAAVVMLAPSADRPPAATASASPPAKTKSLTPAARSAASCSPGPACQIDMPCAGGLKGLRRRSGLRGIDLVGRAQAGQRRAGGLEGGGERRRIGKSFGIDRLDAAGLEKALGKGRARGEVGGRAEIGEKDLAARPWLSGSDPSGRASASNGAASRIGASASNLIFASP